MRRAGLAVALREDRSFGAFVTRRRAKHRTGVVLAGRVPEGCFVGAGGALNRPVDGRAGRTGRRTCLALLRWLVEDEPFLAARAEQRGEVRR